MAQSPKSTAPSDMIEPPAGLPKEEAKAAEAMKSGSFTPEQMVEYTKNMLDRLDNLATAIVGSRQQQEAAMNERLQQLQSAMPGGGQRIYPSGEVIEVRPGELIGYFPHKGGIGIARGGWFKVEETAEPSTDISVVSVAIQGFKYDKMCGAPYHQIKHHVYKRYWADTDKNPIVGSRNPKPEQIRPPVQQMQQPVGVW